MKEDLQSNVNNENEDIIKMWEPLKFDIGLNYKYVKNNIFFKLISNLFYYIIVAPIIFLISKIIFGLRIEGKENLKNIKSGAISVSNHVQYIDCAMLGLAWFPRRIYYTAKTDGFKMPVVRHLVRLLYAIPIPEKISCKENFYKAIDDLLAKNKVVHFYPETSLWPYYNKLRNFKNGAFKIASKNNVPIIPFVFSFRKPTGILKLFKSKPCLILSVLPPVYPKQNLAFNERYLDLKENVYKKMSEKI